MKRFTRLGTVAIGSKCVMGNVTLEVIEHNGNCVLAQHTANTGRLIRDSYPARSFVRPVADVVTLPGRKALGRAA